MIIPIINDSALEFWLDGTDKNEFSVKANTDLAPNFPFSISKNLSASLAREYNLTMPISLMVPEKRRRCSNNVYHLFSYPASLPPKSFVELTDHFGETIMVSSPEYCFVYAASKLPFYEAVRIGCMLCAIYVFDKTYGMQQRSRIPITSKKKIQKYLQTAQGMKGIRSARKAIQYVVDNCNSPMEVSLAVLACLPISQGGYALKTPSMNKLLRLSSPNAAKMNIGNLHGDMVWENHKLVVEYDSILSHLQKEQHEYDKRRASVIVLSGYQMINLTAGQLSSFYAIEETFLMIRHLLGMQRISARMKQYEDLRWEVVHEILLKKKTIQQILFGSQRKQAGINRYSSLRVN